MAPSVKCCYDRLGYLSSIPTQFTKPGMHRVAIPGILGAHEPASALPLCLVIAPLTIPPPLPPPSDLYLEVRAISQPSSLTSSPIRHMGWGWGRLRTKREFDTVYGRTPNPHTGVTCSHPAHVETFNMIWSQALTSKQPGVRVGVGVLIPAPSL